MDVSQYLEIFIDETKEHLQNLNEQLLILEREPDNTDTINEIFRAAHSLKGMAGTMGYKIMQRLTHDMENVFSEIRNGSMKVTSGLIDILFQCLDALEEYTSCIQETADEGSNENKPLIDQLNEFLKGGGAAEKSEAPAAEAAESLPLHAHPHDGPPRLPGERRSSPRSGRGHRCLLKGGGLLWLPTASVRNVIGPGSSAS